MYVLLSFALIARYKKVPDSYIVFVTFSRASGTLPYCYIEEKSVQMLQTGFRPKMLFHEEARTTTGRKCSQKSPQSATLK